MRSLIMFVFVLTVVLFDSVVYGQSSPPALPGATTPPIGSSSLKPTTVGEESSTTSDSGAGGDASAAPTSHSTGPLETQTITWPDRVPVMFIEETKIIDDRGDAVTSAIRVRSKITEAPGIGDVADRMREVVLRGSMQVKDLEPAVDADTGEPGDPQRGSDVTWTSVLDPASGRLANLRSPLQSSFRTTGDEVSPSTTVNAQGDVAGLADAVGLLYGDDAESLATVAEEAAAAAAAGEEGQSEDGSSLGVNDLQAGSGSTGSDSRGASSASGSGLPQSSTDFKIPETVGGEATTTEAAAVVGTTTEGCPPRVDLANNTVVIQSQVTNNGTPSGDCTDTSERFTLQKSYSACSDDVDRAAGTAYATFRRYYVDGGGTSEYVDGECVRDNELAFDIVEDTSNCSVDVDTNAMTATPRSQLVYTNRVGNSVVVATCQASESAEPISIEETSAGCALRHDFDAGVSYKQTKLKYLRTDGVEVVVQSCGEDGTTYAHTKVNDQSVCGADIDLGAGNIARQYRTQITIDGVSQYITECALDADTLTALQKDKSACSTTFFHNTGAGQSFGAERLYHELYGAKEFVTSCQIDEETTYTHQVATVSYQHNDNTKSSKPLTRIYIDTPIGEVEVSGAQVREGAPDLPYTLTASEVRETGNVSYDDGSCNKYSERANVDVYERIDETEYLAVGELAAPSGPTDACSNQNSSWVLDRTSSGRVGYCSCTWDQSMGDGVGGYRCSGNKYAHTGYYTATHIKTREDGEVIVNTSAEESYSCGQSCGGASCPDPAPSSQQNTWYTENGWN